MSGASIVQTLTELADDLETDYVTECRTLPVEGRTVILAAIREARGRLADFASVVEADIVATAPKRFVVEGIGEVELKTGIKRTAWQHAELIAAIVSRTMDEPEMIFDAETGELLPYVQIGTNLAQRLRECVSMGGGKVTGLRALGIDETEYCTVEHGHKAVVLPPKKVT